MARTARDLMQTALVTVSVEATLRRAASALAENEVGVALVQGRSGVVGIVSERDIIRALAEGADPDDERVADVMSYDVLSVTLTEPLEQVAAKMDEGGVRHLVIKDGDTTKGVLSQRDLIRWYLSR